MNPLAPGHCRFCGKKLWLLKRLCHADFCSDSHQAAHEQQQNELMLARLYQAGSSADNKPNLPDSPGKRASAA
jgi:hypothetical protein